MKILLGALFLILAYMGFATTAGVTILSLPKETAVTDSTYFQSRKVSPDSISRKVSFGLVKDTTRKIAQDSARKISQDTAKKVVHDSLTVRVPQAIDTAATPRFHTLKVAYSATGSTTAALSTANCPAHTGTAPNQWLGLIFVNGDTLWIPGWK